MRTSSTRAAPRVAIVGAGIAGATCARALATAGWAVQVFDKARGPGGRLATRRLTWTDQAGQARSARVDHGAPAFQVRSEAFRDFLRVVGGDATLSAWTLVRAPHGRAGDDSGAWCLPVPDMPSLCRSLLHALPLRLSCAVDRLRREAGAWWIDGLVDGDRAAAAGPFEAVVLALPPSQASPLLAPHQAEAAERAAQAGMQPCWTLMGVSRWPVPELGWQVLMPRQGPLAWLHRDDLRPGRAAATGEAHWVAHAHGDWSHQHLEQPAEAVRARLQAAIDAELQSRQIEPLQWHHAVVHRWRYAMPKPGVHVPVDRAWWHAPTGLGVCGDFLGGDGVEGAWQSAQALVRAMTEA